MSLLILVMPVLLYAHTPFIVLASTVGGGMNNIEPGTSSIIGGGSSDGITVTDNQSYRNFKSCLSDAEVNGVATEQQVYDCGSKNFPNWNRD